VSAGLKAGLADWRGSRTHRAVRTLYRGAVTLLMTVGIIAGGVIVTAILMYIGGPR